MKRLYTFSAIALAVTVLAVEYDLSRRMKLKPEAKRSAASQEAAVSQVDAQVETGAAATPEESFFDSQVLRQAQKLSSIQTDPRTLDHKMDELARALTPLEIRKLAVVVRSKTENEDRRAMAVELLSRSKTRDAILMLKEFVGSRHTYVGPVTNRKRELEFVLRAQAIEGIAAYPQKELALSYLNSLAGQVQETFLKDRIARSEEGLKGRVPNTQHKDEAALKQLVQ